MYLAGACNPFGKIDDWFVSEDSFCLSDIKVASTTYTHDSKPREPRLFPQYDSCNLGTVLSV